MLLRSLLATFCVHLCSDAQRVFPGSYGLDEKRQLIDPARASRGRAVSEHTVMADIFKGYNPIVRPVRNHNDSIKIMLDPALYAIYEVNEAQETITFSQWYRVNWHDEFLTWDPADYGGIEMIKPRASLVWQPDLTLYGMIETKNTIAPDQTLVQLNYTGHILYAEAQNVRMHCTYDVSHFPFDRQACLLHYTSWMFNDEEVSLYHSSDEGVTQYFQHNTEWDLNSFTGHREIHTYVEGVYSEVYYTIRMRRKPLYYMLNIVVPSFTITSLAIVGLFSPFKHSDERQEKVTMGLTTLLTMAVLLLMVSNEMPKTSDGMPLLGLFLMCELLVASAATVCAVMVMYLHHFGPRSPVLASLAQALGLTDANSSSYQVPTHLTALEAQAGGAEVNLTSQRAKPSSEISALLRRASKNDGDEPGGIHIGREFIPRLSLAEFSHTDSTAPEQWGTISDKVDIVLLISFLLIHTLMTLCFFLPVMD